MEAFKILLILLGITILVLNSSLVLAINSDEGSVTVMWDSGTYYQGDVALGRISFISNFSQPLEIFYVGVNFDWFSADNFQGFDLSENPITIPSYGSYSFQPIKFDIPVNVSVGEHDYFVGIDGSYRELDGSLPIGFSWDSQIFTLHISNSLEKTYLDLNIQVLNKLSQASVLTYDSPVANDLLSQALEAKNAASIFALNNQFGEAITSLNQASGYVELIDDEEELFDQQQGSQNQVILIVLIGAIATILIVIIIKLLNKRKKNFKEIDQPTNDPIAS